MNLNDFVVLPNNKAKSVKLNARNLQELHMKTVTLDQESKEMEEKLQQLKESMSKEKEERGHSGAFRWKSGQCGSLNINSLTNGTKKNKENTVQKLSAGKVKIRLLKDEPLAAFKISYRAAPWELVEVRCLAHGYSIPPQPPALPPAISHRTTRKNRLRGTICGQCEVKTAGVMCAECTEAYCIGCFAKFHQKGALKLHRIIPIQTDLQTHVSTREVVDCFQKQMNPSSDPSAFTNQKLSPSSGPSHNPPFSSNTITRRGDQKPETGTEAMAKHMQLHPDPGQVLFVNHGEEIEVETTGDGREREDKKGFSTSLFGGEYNEEVSARSFQEALRQWRGERSDVEGETMIQDAMWTPVRPVSVSAMATQANLPPDRGAEGQGRGGREGRVPIRVEFIENSLTYMDRLLLKKHRSILTNEEEDFRRYCASLFAVPVSRSRTEPQITTTESCVIIEVMDEADRDINGLFVAEQRADNNIKVPSVQQVSSKGREPVPQTLLTSGGFSRVSPSPTSRTQPSRQPKASTQTKAPQKLHMSKPPTPPAEQSMIYSGDEMSTDSLGLIPHEEDSSDEEPKMHGCLARGRSREEDQGNSATSHLEDPFVPAEAEKENDVQTDEPEQLSEPSMVMHNQKARSGSEQSCDLDEFSPLGLGMNCGSVGYRPSSSLTTYTEEHLVFRMMKDNPTQKTGILIHSTTPTGTGQISANEQGTSGAWSNLFGKSTLNPRTDTSPLPASVPPSLSHYPSPRFSACLSPTKLGSELGPVFRPLSQAAQEIMDICSVDQVGCEDPDLETEATAHTLHDLEQELRLMAKATAMNAPLSFQVPGNGTPPANEYAFVDVCCAGERLSA
ncbi:zinc finger B-box domain-containing protein 1 [Scomber scombrus]|uniref:zinc finger B-box domain-containing protein 1 n=1 Tax=Scomber scombrus TaxID=13677 RepID=UPI002DD9EB14|nr:zinc finger B-box domain-containing protein 1 [Scomber scombrus]